MNCLPLYLFSQSHQKLAVMQGQKSKIGEVVYFLLLEISAAAHMISEEELELKIEGGPRGLLAAGVEDVDAAYEALKARGAALLRPPTDQPWGLRTAYFADPEGNIWEINQPIGA